MAKIVCFSSSPYTISHPIVPVGFASRRRGIFPGLTLQMRPIQRSQRQAHASRRQTFHFYARKWVIPIYPIIVESQQFATFVTPSEMSKLPFQMTEWEPFLLSLLLCYRCIVSDVKGNIFISSCYRGKYWRNYIYSVFCLVKIDI